MLFNEPKLLKSERDLHRERLRIIGFSALQRAEIAEIYIYVFPSLYEAVGFSALQRAEIAEIARRSGERGPRRRVSVLFNEPKLLKWK